MLLTTMGTDALLAVLPAGIELPRTLEIGIDLRILVFAFAVTILTAVLSGLLPSFGLTRAGRAALSDARGFTAGRGRHRVGHGVVIAEMAFALILLAGASLLVRSFWELTRMHPGFEPERLVTMRITLSAATHDGDDRIRSFSRELLERIGRLSG